MVGVEKFIKKVGIVITFNGRKRVNWKKGEKIKEAQKVALEMNKEKFFP